MPPNQVAPFRIPRYPIQAAAGATPAAPTNLIHVDVHDLHADISFTELAGGYRIMYKAGLSQTPPSTPTDAGYTIFSTVTSVTPGTHLVSVTLPTNDDNYTIAVYTDLTGTFSTTASVVNAFACPPPIITAVGPGFVAAQITTNRIGWPVFELNGTTPWPELGSSFRVDGSSDGPTGFTLYDVGEDPKNLSLGSPLPAGGWPLGSSGQFFRYDFTVPGMKYAKAYMAVE